MFKCSGTETPHSITPGGKQWKNSISIGGTLYAALWLFHFHLENHNLPCAERVYYYIECDKCYTLFDLQYAN